MTKKLEKFRVQLIVTAVVAGIMIIVANSAIWANRYLVNSDTFTKTAVTSLTSDSSTEALASEIVDTALADYPVVKNIVGDTATNFISGLLGSGRMEQALTAAISRIQIFLTSPQKDPVVIDLSGAKSTVEQLITLSGRQDQVQFDVNKIPNQITVFDPSNYPNFYQYTVVLTWLSPLMALGAIALLAWPYIAHRNRYREIMIIQGAIVAAAGVFGLLIGPLFRPLVLGNVTSANLRVVVGNLYDAFIATFNSQTMFIVWAGLLAIAVSVGIILYDHYKLRAKHAKVVAKKK